MAIIEVVLPGGDIAIVSSNQSPDELKKTILSRQQIAANYCISKGWPTDPSQLTFDQIIEIRKTKDWISAGR